MENTSKVGFHASFIQDNGGSSGPAAILLSAFQNYGIQPGPQLFETSANLVWALIASLYIGNVMLLVLNLPMVKLWVKLIRINW